MSDLERAVPVNEEPEPDVLDEQGELMKRAITKVEELKVIVREMRESLR